jgi:hypothetical protein
MAGIIDFIPAVGLFSCLVFTFSIYKTKISQAFIVSVGGGLLFYSIHILLKLSELMQGMCNKGSLII